MARKQRTAIAATIIGNSSKIIACLLYVKCFAMIRQSNADPNVARVAAMLNVVLIMANPIADRDCTGGCLLFAFCFFVAICRSLLGQVLPT
jgi:hypothetical protein